MIVRRRAFTLLEVMVALTLLVIAGSFAGWKMHGAIQNKRFRSDLDRVLVRFQTCQKLAAATQSDWRGDLRREGDHWIFETICEENFTPKRFTPLRFQAATFFLNGKETERVEIDFFSTGHVLPKGTFLFFQKKNNPSSLQRQWEIPQIFQNEEGNGDKKLGPVHPADLK